VGGGGDRHVAFITAKGGKKPGGEGIKPGYQHSSDVKYYSNAFNVEQLMVLIFE
jgi:hypothetical protein